jgi:ribosomal protein S18 acetylase RimI-like enzyme
MGDLAAKAIEREANGKLLGLFVHPDNTAIGFYEKLGFKRFGVNEPSVFAGIDYPGMIADPRNLDLPIKNLSPMT